jgi:hypothetical protein
MFLLASVLLVLAQATPMTNLVVTGVESGTFTASNANACYVGDNNALNAQLTDPSSSMIISFTVLGTVGDHPAANQLTALTLDGPADDAFVNWSATGGTVSVDDLGAGVPVEGGDGAVQASTAGVLGHIDADLTSKQGTFHVSGPFACHSPT